MMKNYFLLLLVFPLFVQAQTVEFESSITADLSAYSGTASFAGLGEYEIFPDFVDGILDKPIILVDGFDPGDTRDINGLYSLLDFTGTSGAQNLADLVRAEGFDVVVLNFPQYLRLSDNTLLNVDDATDTNADMVIDELDYPGSTLIDGGADFMERNAMLLVELINTLNANKVGEEELVIIGPSMGGLISRYALNYMENQTIDHETRLWISFDAPHHGANVPLGFQHQFNFLAFGLGEDLNVAELQPVVNGLLKSSAARQLLVDHLEPHLASGSDVEFDPTKLLPEPHPFKVIFDANINSLTPTGFPQNTRNVSIINGSGIGSPYKAKDGVTNVTPGFTVIDDTFNVPDAPLPTTAQIGVNLTPATADGSQLISKILVEANFFGTITIFDIEVNAQAPSFSDGVDAASGGLFDLGGFTDGLGSEGLVGDFIAALQIDKFNFIPSVSAMALESTNNEINWYHNINLSNDSTEDTTNSTPFVNWYMPTDNENHVQLTEANVLFALDEIMPETLSNSEFDNVATLKIGKNPIDHELLILSNSTISDATISLIDITGKLVYNTTNTTLSSRTTIPLNLDSGVYVLNIENKEGISYKTKIAVK